MITAILFDLFETLITETHLQPTRAGSLGPVLGLQPEAYRPEWKARRPRIVVGQLSFADALADISNTLVGTVNMTVVERICQQRIKEKAAAYVPHDETKRLVDDLVRRGIRLGVVSNGFREDILPWSEWPLAPAFHCAAFSCDEGVAKPDPEIYRRAVRRMEVDPATTVYIGDGGDDELAGAEAAGLRAHCATWFVQHAAQAAYPKLLRREDVLELVTAGT